MGSRPSRTACRSALMMLLVICLMPYSSATASPTEPTRAPTISGDPVVGETLTAEEGNTYQ